MEQNRTEIQESINTELKNNVYKYITPYRLRLVLSKIKESFFNIVDDTAEKIKFSSPQFTSTNVKTALEEALSGGLTTGFGTLDFEYLDAHDGSYYPIGRYKQLKIKGGKPNEKLNILFHTGLPDAPVGYPNYQSGATGSPNVNINGVGNVAYNNMNISRIIINPSTNIDQNNYLFLYINSRAEKYKTFLYDNVSSSITPLYGWINNNFTKRARHIPDDYSALAIGGSKNCWQISNPEEITIQLDSNGEFLFTNSLSVSGTIDNTAYYVDYSVEICSSDSRLITDVHNRKISSYIYPTMPTVSH